MWKKKLIIASFFILLIIPMLRAVQLKHIDTVYLKGSDEDDFIKVPSFFSVTEDGLCFVMDRKEADLKIFDSEGKMVKRIGRKGHGPNEFMNPDNCDYYQGQFLVQDLGSRKYSLFERDEENIVKEAAVFRPLYIGNDISLLGNGRALISGFTPGKKGKGWGGFIYNFRTKEITYLLRDMKKYGYSNVRDYKRNRKDISIIGSSGYCDWRGDYAYFLWKGNLKIHMVNMKTREIKTFGHKTANYRQPVVTDALKKAYGRVETINDYVKEAEKFSYAYGVFTTKDYVMTTYEKVLEPGEKYQERMMQFYTLDGKFINEVIVPCEGAGGIFFSKDKEDDILYLFRRKIIEKEDEDEELFLLSRYKLIK
jgi:hypothetical protein